MQSVRKTREERRREIVAAALEVAADRGAGETTTQAIADRVGIAQATVFRHFRSRDEIFASALERIGRELFRALRAPLAGSASPAQRLRELIRRQLAFIGARRGLPRLLLSDRLHLENPALKRIVLGIMGRYAGEVSRLLREGVERGEFRSELDPDRTAELLLALVQGLVVRWSLSDFSFRLEAQADEVWALLRPALERPV